MITYIDPYFESQSIPVASAAPIARNARHRVLHTGPSALDRSRAEREASFEQAYGSLWEHGLLDRLTTPLTRYHE